MFDLQAIEDAKQDAIARYPEESCGAITKDGYVPLKNTYKEPEKGFDCLAEGTALSLQTKIICLIHSHPTSALDMMNGDYGPSCADMQQQIIMNIPWGIIITDGVSTKDFFWGDSLPTIPLEGRQFRHGPSGTDGRGDCYALIRDWYKINKNVVLDEIPRDNSWWTESIGQNLYLDNFQKVGFSVASKNDPKIGDVALGMVLSNIPNHGGIYVGNGLILHHLPKRYSRIEPIGNWMKFITHWLRKNE